MKRKQILLLLLISSSISYAQVGVNTEIPKSTLHILPTKFDGSTAEGIIAPNLTRAQLITKDAKYTTAQKGSIVYVTDLSGTLTTKTAKVTQIGYYYFDGEVWQQFATSAAGNIPTEPWRVQGGVKEATTNAENIYQQGKVAIGVAQTAGVTSETLLVNGATGITGNTTIGKAGVANTTPGTGDLRVHGVQVFGTSEVIYPTTNFVMHIFGTGKAGGLWVQKNAHLQEKVTIGTGLTATDDALIVSKGKTTLDGKVGIGRVPATGDFVLAITGNTNNGGFLTVGDETGKIEAGRKFQVQGSSNVTGNSKVGSSTVLGNETVGGISKVGGTTTLNSSAQLELGDDNKGFLPNRVALTSSTVKAPITNAVDGMIVYNTTSSAAQNLSPGFYYWRGTNWQRLVDEIPVTGVRMYYQTQSYEAGPASGGVFDKMNRLYFSNQGVTNSPTPIILQEDGSYAINIKLFTNYTGKTGQTFVPPTGPFMGTVYVGVWINNVLQDVSEVFPVIMPRNVPGTALQRASSNNVVLGCTGKAGDEIVIKMGYYINGLPTQNAFWSMGETYPTAQSARTTLIYWKL